MTDKAGDAYKRVTKQRQAQRAQLRAARALLVGDSEMTAEQLMARHRQLKADFLTREQERAA